MTQSTSNRIVSARTWIVIQDVLVKGAASIAALGLVGYIGAFIYGSIQVATVIATVAIVISIAFLALSWALEEFRINGMPFEEAMAGRGGGNR